MAAETVAKLRGSVVCYLVAAIVVAMLAAACEPGNAIESVDKIEINTDLGGDQAWHELMSSDNVAPKLQGTGDERFIQKVELANQRRRELGLKFWDEFADDPRRYTWLLMSVGLPPAYPTDLHAWANHELGTDPNPMSFDEHKQRLWSQLYPSMREEFWNSSHVTDQQRRLLWTLELMQELESSSMRDRDAVLAEVLDYARTYPKPFGEPDSVLHTQLVSLVGRKVFDGIHLTGPSPESDEDGRLRNLVVATRNRRLLATFDGLVRLGAKDVAGETNTSTTFGWENLPRINAVDYSTYAGKVIGRQRALIYKRMYRALGLNLWQRVDNRDQKLRWLISTLDSPPYYVKKIEDALAAFMRGEYSDYVYAQDERDTWEAKYEKLRAEIWDHPGTSDSERAVLRQTEVWFELWDAQRMWLQDSDSASLERLVKGIHELYDEYGILYDIGIKVILREPHKYGMAPDAVKEFLHSFPGAHSEELKALQAAFDNQQKLKLEPFEFQGKTLDREDFDLRAYRGNIVLVDHWSTSCASCIYAMPRLHEIYEAYKDEGFEVVSIAYDGSSNRKNIMRIEHELDLSWITVNGEGQWETIRAKYGYQGFPQYMLLNRDGTLFAGTGEVDMGRNLEALLEEMLAAEAAEKEDATVH